MYQQNIKATNVKQTDIISLPSWEALSSERVWSQFNTPFLESSHQFLLGLISTIVNRTAFIRPFPGTQGLVTYHYIFPTADCGSRNGSTLTSGSLVTR